MCADRSRESSVSLCSRRPALWLDQVLGIAVCALGAVLVSKARNLQDNVELQREILADLNVVIIAFILGICGGLIILTSLCGIIGAWKKWRRCLVFVCAVSPPSASASASPTLFGAWYVMGLSL